MPKINADTVDVKPVYIGIDPGLSGGLILIQDGVPRGGPMPDTELDVWTWIRTVSAGPRDKFAMIEDVWARPGQGVTSMFTFGKGYGGLCMALTAAAIPYERVRPQVWQRALGITPKHKSEKGNAWKDRLRATAQRLYPKLDFWNETLSVQRAVSDALLIATYCQRKHEGKL